ncbi:MAG TPA: hypothetical protein OIL94_09320 [Rikenellaceae bacterium]|nr:hypothetical protein [Rikenellaceae bacterium]
MPHLEILYGRRLLRRELFIYTDHERGEWADVVTGPWYEGPTLGDAVIRAAAAGDRERLLFLAVAFDRLVLAMLRRDWAHGDLKPENIIVTARGLRLVDFDASYLPALAGEPSPELGTAAYQHPARTVRDYDRHLDDFPAALLSTALHALALDPGLYGPHTAHRRAALRPERSVWTAVRRYGRGVPRTLLTGGGTRCTGVSHCCSAHPCCALRGWRS